MERDGQAESSDYAKNWRTTTIINNNVLYDYCYIIIAIDFFVSDSIRTAEYIRAAVLPSPSGSGLQNQTLQLVKS